MLNEEKIRKDIIKLLDKYRMLAKPELVEGIVAVNDCTKKQASDIIIQMKKENILYSVKGFPGFLAKY